MKAFTQLPPKTQKLLVTVAVALLVMAGSATSWSLHQRAAAAQRRFDASSANLQALAALVQRFEERQAAGATGLDLSAIVTRSLQGRSFQPSQIQQQDGELALRLDNAPFADVLAWMVELGEAGLVFSKVGVAQGQEGVNLTLVLRAG